MGLTQFKYLRLRRILAFMVVLTLSSMLSSLTALSLLSFYKGLSAYMGEGENVIIVYDMGSRTPFTGLVPAFLADKIMAVDSVLACSPEVIAPCIVKGEPIFLRGVLPEEFLKINGISIIDGEKLSPKELNYAMIGIRASEKTGLKAGDKVLVTGVLSQTCLELHIKGVFASGSPLDDEIIAPLHVGQWLRGAGYNHVTIIRVKVHDINVQEEVLSVISKASTEPSREGGQTQPSGQGSFEQAPIRWLPIRFRAEDIGVEGAERFLIDYMERYGVTRETIIVLSAATLIFSGSVILLSTQALISQHSREIRILRFIGASRKILVRDLTLKIAPISLLASALGTTLAASLLGYILESGLLQILSHSIQIYLDTYTIILIALSILAITLLGIRTATK